MPASGFSAAMGVLDSCNLDRELAKARDFVASLFDQTGLVRFTDYRALDGYIVGRHSISFVKASELGSPMGPKKYFQLFYRCSYVWVRLKDQPRSRSKSGGHMAVILAAGDSWEEEVGKISRTGDLVPKRGFIRRFDSEDGLSDLNDYRRLAGVGSTVKDIYSVEDAWADSCHFDLPENFDWNGVEQRF